MPSPSVHATIADLDMAHSKGIQVLGDTQATISQLEGRINSMLAVFTGQARVAFEAQFADWKQQMIRLTTELERIANAAKASAERQRQLEADSVAAVNASA
jgi:WXG100 family type VII secretion target